MFFKVLILLHFFQHLKADRAFVLSQSVEEEGEVGVFGQLSELLGVELFAEGRKGVEEAAKERGGERTKLVAISVRTSMDAEALASIGVTDPVEAEVARLAALAVGAGSDGIVCSPQEAAAMRALLGSHALIVTPGIRPVGSAVGDQQRIATPLAAIEAGSSKLVIGRPIAQAADPRGAFESVLAELTGAKSV